MQNFLFEKFNEKKSVGEILADVRVFGVKTCPSFWRATVQAFLLLDCCRIGEPILKRVEASRYEKIFLVYYQKT